MIDVGLVHRYLVEFLQENTNRQIGFGDVPSKTPTLPYSVMFPLPSPTPTGPWYDPQVDFELVIQITSVGRSPDQAGRQAHDVRQVLVSRDLGQYVYAMHPEGFSVADRILSTVGSIVKSGDRLFEVPDTYRVKVVP